jgi:hypothetical protein
MNTQDPNGKKINNERFGYYLGHLIDNKNHSSNPELEVRFGTRFENKITKIGFNNVMEKLKSLGFKCLNDNGEYHLNINNQYNDKKSGKYRISSIRTTVTGISNIQKYCRNNTIVDSDGDLLPFVSFTDKKRMRIQNKHGGDETAQPIDFDDFGFRVNYKSEASMTGYNPLIKKTMTEWSNTKKIFRYIKRFTFSMEGTPYQIDCSIVKGSHSKGRYIIPEYNIQDSDIFNAEPQYEIELELVNNLIGSDAQGLKKEVFKGIKCILGGSQRSNYPISNSEKNNIMGEYLKLIYQSKTIPEKKINKKNPNKLFIQSTDFVGPSSISLEMHHVVPIKLDDTSLINIRENYVVTDKADGERKLLYISPNGKIYFIDLNMNIQFTGGISKNNQVFNTIFDGEHILNNKAGKFINLYLIFDIYYVNNKDYRMFPFLVKDDLIYYDETMDKTIARYNILCKTIKNLKLEHISDATFGNLKIKVKNFRGNSNIFYGCKQILDGIKDNVMFEYETDGIIFTPIHKSVGLETLGNKGGATITPRKITWLSSLKWKPSEFNTIDFLVSTKKNEDNTEFIGNIFVDGTSFDRTKQNIKYKTLILRVGYDENKHGYINPCEDILQNKLPDFNIDNINNYRPVPFHPTDPVPVTPAHLCNIKLQQHSDGDHMLTNDTNEEFTDNTIVEFRFDKNNREGWQWVPIRVRNDKTAEYKKGNRNFGNNYTTAQSVWRSIHYPITTHMLSTSENIPTQTTDENIYYTKSGTRDINYLINLRDFHNKYVKNKLIESVTKRGDILMDQSVGKGGDLYKWISSRLSFVLGIDYSKDNIENKLNGACARYLNATKKFKNIPKAIFIHGDTSRNYKNGDAFSTHKNKLIMNAVFGKGTKDRKTLGEGLYNVFGRGSDGFNVISNQFSQHYFFENKGTLLNYIRNVSESCKINGYLIGTCYDGKKMFKALRPIEKGESIGKNDNGKQLWQITKQYDNQSFEDDERSLGYQIDVYQESINKTFSEFLVNFTYFTELIESYGFVPLDKRECNKIGLTTSVGNFKELFNNMNAEVKRHPEKKNNYKHALNMTKNEKYISFFNNYFIYKKIRNVDTQSIFEEQMKTTIQKKRTDKRDKRNKYIQKIKKLKIIINNESKE